MHSQQPTVSGYPWSDPSSARWTQPPGRTGAPWTICIANGPTQCLYTSDAYPGRIYKLTLDGKVVGMFGSAGRDLGKFNWLHSIACPSENVVYVADLNN